jgi:hypothetical protein
MLARHSIALAATVAVIVLTSCASGSGTSPSLSRSATTGSITSSSSETAGTPAITISSPAEGEAVSVPFSVSGEANTFEAALTVDAQDASGMTACVRHLMATSGSGTPGTWEGVLAFPPEEDPLELTLRAYSQSPADGSMINLVEVPITVAPDRPRIIVTNPRCGDVYQPGASIILTGTANLFEAALTVELRDSSGTAVVSVPVTAEECCVESQFNATLTVPADLSSGFYDVVAYSLSAQDSSVENEFPIQIEVSGGLSVTG